MTVKELVQKLQEQNQDLEVVVGEEWMIIDGVTEDDNSGMQKPVIVIY